MSATTVTLFTQTLRDAVLYGASEADAALFDRALPVYIERLMGAIPEGSRLVVNDHDLSTSSLRDDDDQALAQELGQSVEFWG